MKQNNQNHNINQQSTKTYRVLAARKGMSNEEWLKLRKGYLNVSEIAAALNLNPFKTALQLWANKTGLYEEEYKDNKYMLWGRIMEPVIREYYAKETGYKIQEVPYILQSTQLPYICGNVDAVATLPDGSKKIVEIKTTSSINESEWKDNGCPIYYYIQILIYEWITGVHNGCLAVLIGGNDFRVIEVPYNEAVVNAILHQCADFWNHVQKCEALPPVEKDNSFLAQLYPKSKPDTITLPKSFSEKLDKLEQLKTKEKALKSDIDVIEAEVKQAMQNNELATIDSWKVSWKTSARNSFSSDKAKSFLTSEQIEACTVSTSTRTLRVSKIKPKTKK